MYRFGRNYNTGNASAIFSANQSVGSVSADGRWVAFTSDWQGELGKNDGTAGACTLSPYNCRADVFILRVHVTKRIWAVQAQGLEVFFILLWSLQANLLLANQSSTVSAGTNKVTVYKTAQINAAPESRVRGGVVTAPDAVINRRSTRLW